MVVVEAVVELPTITAGVARVVLAVVAVKTVHWQVVVQLTKAVMELSLTAVAVVVLQLLAQAMLVAME
jgi:hypothetical protein